MKSKLFLFLTTIVAFVILLACNSKHATLPLIYTSTVPSNLLAETKESQSVFSYTPTPHPTLGKQESEELILDLMINNAECTDFCFWGLIPKETSILEAVDFLSLFGRTIIIGKERDLEFYSTSIRYRENLSISIVLYERHDFIDNIEVYIASLNNQIYTGDLMAFSPEKLMEKYGQPDGVSFFLSYPTELPADDNVGYRYRLYYNDFIIEYSGQRVPATPLLKACPIIDAGLDRVKIWLGEKPSNPPTGGSDLETVTSLTIDDFYQIMIGSPEKACINLDVTKF